MRFEMVNYIIFYNKHGSRLRRLFAGSTLKGTKTTRKRQTADDSIPFSGLIRALSFTQLDTRF